MSEENATLRETVAAAISGNKDTTPAKATETDKGASSQEANSETNSGDNRVFASGLDISDIPEQDRPRIKELLEKKAKLLEGGYQEKFKNVARLSKVQEELKSLGLTEEEVKEAVIRHRDSKLHPVVTDADKKSALKTLDKLLQDSPYEQRSALEQMRTIIQEETGVAELKTKLENLEKILGIFGETAKQSRQKQVSEELVKLSDKYGTDLIDKYRDAMTEKGLQYPNMSLGKIFSIEVPLEEIEQAILSKQKKPLTEDKKKAITSHGSGITSASEKVDVKSKSYAELLTGALKR